MWDKQKNREQIREYDKKWRLLHRDRLNRIRRWGRRWEDMGNKPLIWVEDIDEAI